MRRPYCRDIGPRGEDVWEPAQSKAESIKLDPADVSTTKESAKLLAPLFKPLLRSTRWYWVRAKRWNDRSIIVEQAGMIETPSDWPSRLL